MKHIRHRIFFLVGIALFIAPDISFGQALGEPEQYRFFSEEMNTENIYTMMPSQSANLAVERILRYSGLKKNFIIRSANVPNAEAAIRGTDRYILYNEQFMQRMNETTNTDWAAISILAHEIGHHLQGHTLKNTGSRPPIELEADEYSGFILQRMGASLNEARAVMSILPSEKGSATHRGREDRLKAITDGWLDAQQLSAPLNRSEQPSTESVLKPAAFTSDVTETEGVFYTSRFVFNNDKNPYYLTNTNLIIGFNEYEQPVIIGERVAPTSSDYVWMYKTPFISYGVTQKGDIIGILPSGFSHKVGYVAKPY